MHTREQVFTTRNYFIYIVNDAYEADADVFVLP